MTEPKITVGIPVYNVERYLVQCLLSVMRQDYTNLEILVVDDKSTDRSRYIAEELAKRDDRIRIVYHEKNRSLAGARNTIVKEMSSDYLYWIDSDDYLTPNAVSSVWKVMQESGADIVKTIVKDYDKQYAGEYTSDEYMKILLPDAIRSHLIGCLMKKECLDGVHFEEGKNMADYGEFPTICEKAKKIEVIANWSYRYRDMRKGSITQKAINRFAGYALRAFRTNERYDRYAERYPKECSIILKQFTDYACMAVLMAGKDDNVLPVRAMMYEKERPVMINPDISRYKKWLYRQIISNSGKEWFARGLHKLKHRIVYGIK